MTRRAGTVPRVRREAPRVLTAASMAVLVVITGFLLWSSQATAARVGDVTSSSRLSDDYRTAAASVADEESTEREFFLDPTPAVRAAHAAAAASLGAALGRIAVDGTGADGTLAATEQARQHSYLTAVTALFDAIDAGRSAAEVAVIDRQQVDPAFDAIKDSVDAAAEAHHRQTLVHLNGLRDLAAVLRVLTPIVFLGGLVLIAAFTTVTRRYRRERDGLAADSAHAALHDALTGLPNRVLLAERLGQEMRANDRRGTHSALLLLDLDRFKEVNDTLGHQYGDLLLTLVGPRLRGELRDIDTVARLGGDEFGVLLPDVGDVAGALEVTDRLCRAFAAPFEIDGAELDVEVSVGLVVSGEHGADAATLLRHADVAMYVAKDLGTPVAVYHPDTDGHTRARLALLGDLRRAIERDELVLHYQPKVSISTGDIVGAEALVRWRHPERGLIPPDEFIPLAERTGLMGQLTRHVLDAALAQARTWQDAGLPMRVAVNISARDLLDEHLPGLVAARLAAHGLSAGSLVVEVTESAVTTEPVRARRLLNGLHELGIRVSLDDFGAGYTSLAQLKTLPLTELKIDRSFIATLTTDPSSAVIVQSVVDLSHNLGLTAVAEGIETEADWQALERTGCDVGQGFHLSRALPAAEFAAWCLRFRARADRTRTR